ncbi:GntR family transcriptional regulator [Azospirillum sp. SYSU D00513]|uniref:GntR family transcriptional regulator n=1 Tax=Azospirillum sp. SYSU D00513 TaxID=2812561 RepID=UPI001A977D26|nr:GntR family transcriptional regulator [Azospirillum sp. SYSU D00513]
MEGEASKSQAPGPAAGRSPRLHEQVASEIERRVAAGHLEAGAPLFEVTLAEEFGVSRAPVRAALQRLERAGLVRRSENRRSYVVADGAPVPGLLPNAAPDAAPAGQRLTAAASWAGIYQDVSRQATVRAAFGRWRIVETELALHYGVSRTVAREVLARLEHVGIIRKDSRSRWYLPALTRDRAGELYEMRRILEPVALRKAARHVPRALLAAMRAELEAARERPDQVPPRELDRLEQRMHVELLSHGDNATLLETLQHYHALLITNSVLYEATSAAFQSDPFIEEHLDIVRALEAGRSEEAAERLEEHLRVSLGRALGRIDRLVRNGALEPLRYLTPAADAAAKD